MFCRLSLSWELCDVFLVICWGGCGFSQENHRREVLFSPHHVTGTSHQRDEAP